MELDGNVGRVIAVDVVDRLVVDVWVSSTGVVVAGVAVVVVAAGAAVVAVVGWVAGAVVAGLVARVVAVVVAGPVDDAVDESVVSVAGTRAAMSMLPEGKVVGLNGT